MSRHAGHAICRCLSVFALVLFSNLSASAVEKKTNAQARLLLEAPGKSLRSNQDSLPLKVTVFLRRSPLNPKVLRLFRSVGSSKYQEIARLLKDSDVVRDDIGLLKLATGRHVVRYKGCGRIVRTGENYCTQVVKHTVRIESLETPTSLPTSISSPMETPTPIVTFTVIPSATATPTVRQTATQAMTPTPTHTHTRTATVTPTLAVGAARTYYLDAQNGNDSNAGTSAAPWKTLAKAQASLRSGDTVLLRSGEYGKFSQNVGGQNQTDWITYRAAPDANPIFTQIEVRGLDVDGYLRFDGIEVSLPHQGACFTHYGQAKNIVSFVGLSHVQFINGEVHADRVYDSVLAVGFDGNGKDAHDFLLQNTEVHTSGFGIRFRGEDIKIVGNHVHHIHATTIGAAPSPGAPRNDNGAWFVTIENNHIHDMHFFSDEPCYAEGGWSVSHSSSIAVRGHDYIIKNNQIHDVYFGIQLYNENLPNYSIYNILFEGNLMYDISSTLLSSDGAVSSFMFYNPGRIDGPVIMSHNTFIGHLYALANTTSDPLSNRFYQAISTNLRSDHAYDGLGSFFENNIVIGAVGMNNFTGENYTDASAQWFMKNNLIYTRLWNQGNIDPSNVVIAERIKRSTLPTDFADSHIFKNVDYNIRHRKTCSSGGECDLRLKAGSISCTMSDTGSYVGALACD